MISEQVLISLAYDTGTGVVKQLRDERACRQAVEDAAESTASEIDGITEADLLDIFRAELDGEALATIDVSDARSELTHALKVQANTPRNISYGAVLDSFLQAVESNLIETGQPEAVSRILYEYTKETNALAETITAEIQHRHDRYHQDLKSLTRWSERLAPEPSSYQLPGTETRVDLPGVDAINSAVDTGENVLVTGPAGVGKSGVLAERYHESTEQNPVYFLDAREFGQFDSITAVEGAMGIQTSLRDVFGELATQYDQCTLLVDQLDNVRTEPVATVFRNLLLDLAEVDGLTVICACRHWDLEQPVYERLAEADTFQKVTLEPLSESQVQSLLTNIGIDEGEQTQEVIELSQSLLNLSLLADVYVSADDFDTNTISSQVALWNAYHDSLDREGSRTNGAVPQTWEDSPVERAVSHARTSLRDGTSTFTIDDRNRGDQRLISRGTITEDWKRTYQFRHDQLQSYFYARDANERGWSVEDILADGVDERIAADVFDWLLQFYSEDSARCTSFIRNGLGSDSPLGFYARYVLAASARDLGPSRLPRETVTAIVDTLQTDRALAREFYRDLTSPDWVRYLVDKQRLSSSGQFAANYVAELADENPDLFIEAVNVDKPPSRSHLRAYLSVTEVLNEQHLVEFTDYLVEQLPSVESDTVHRLGRDLRNLIEELLSMGCADAARELITILTEPTGKEAEERELAGNTSISVTIGSRIRPQTLHSLFDERGEELVETCGSSLVSILDENLRTCLDYLATDYVGDVAPEQAMRRQTALIVANPTRVEVALLRALESSLAHLLTTDPIPAREYLQAYRTEGGVFRRTALAVLASVPQESKHEVREVLTEPSNIDDDTITTEFITLLREGFEVLSADEQATLLKRIMDGPDEDAIRERISDHPDIEPGDELDREVRTRVERWQLRRLYQVRDQIEDPYRSTVEQLIDRHGHIEYSPGSGYRLPVSIGDEQDEATHDVVELDAEEFVTACIEYARQYQPETEPDSFTAGTRDRLEEEVYDRVCDSPNTHLPLFPKLVETGDEVFVDRFVAALQSLIINRDYEDTTIHNWEPVVEGLVAFCDSDSLETTWPRDSRQSVAELLQTIVGHKRSTLPVAEFQTDLATVLTALLADPDPEESTESWNRSIGNERAVYVDGVRATTVVATSHFLRVLHGEEDSQNHQDLWDRLVDLRTDPARPVRFAIGKQLTTLYALNESFVTSNLDTLLPEGESREELSRFTAVWEGYLTTRQLRPSLFEMLRSKYDHAIDIHKRSVTDDLKNQDTNADVESDDESESSSTKLYGAPGSIPTQATYDARAFEPLCSHLACAYAESCLDLTDNLIQSVLAVDPSDLSAEDPASADRVFADTFSDILSNAKSPETEHQYWERIMAFWTGRLEAIEDTPPTALGQYADVLANTPPTASFDDVVELLVETAPAMTDTLHSRRVLEFLATEVEDGGKESACEAMIVLNALVDHTEQPYRFTASDERWTVVTKAAADGDERALRVAEQFFQQGEAEYERVIERYKTDSESP
ncbi:ATP-binding protein [Halorubrum sp. C191]|uniref:ATP-binding protein n=1 Tax=Halorubrum sp. C191 TaxID=1383842 RepID=UPI0011818964|nr:ATP-binding protein [Halorubrum sp. C191]